MRIELIFHEVKRFHQILDLLVMPTLIRKVVIRLAHAGIYSLTVY